MALPRKISTIGYSNTSFEVFMEKLKTNNINAVADVRSIPYSRYTSQFNKDTIKRKLKENGVSYVFIGDMIGGRPEKEEYYTDGVADYKKMSLDKDFKEGIKRIIDGSKKYNIALACSEQNPFTCHRFLLVSKELIELGFNVCHILKDGSVKFHNEVEQDIINSLTKKEKEIVTKSDNELEAAYYCNNKRYAYKKK